MEVWSIGFFYGGVVCVSVFGEGVCVVYMNTVRLSMCLYWMHHFFHCQHLLVVMLQSKQSLIL